MNISPIRHLPLTADSPSRIELTGRFVEFTEMRDGRPRRMLVESQNRLYQFKVAKPLRSDLARWLRPETQIFVVAEAKWDRDTNAIKRKAVTVYPASTPRPAAPVHHEPLGCIRVCLSKKCCRRGGEALAAALEREVSEAGLNGRLRVKSSGCLGNCKDGPSFRMPNGDVYSGAKHHSLLSLLPET